MALMEKYRKVLELTGKLPIENLAIEEKDGKLFITGNTPYPGRGPVTRDFARTLDPFVTLAAAASVTTRLRIATGICLLIQRDTIHTAKTVATLDQLSGGRVLFGVGGGWNKPEMENHGTSYKDRFAIVRDRAVLHEVRSHAGMTAVAASLTEQDMADLAAYYSAGK